VDLLENYLKTYKFGCRITHDRLPSWTISPDWIWELDYGKGRAGKAKYSYWLTKTQESLRHERKSRSRASGEQNRKHSEARIGMGADVAPGRQAKSKERIAQYWIW